MDVAVAARAPGALELLDDRRARLGPLVGRGGRGPGVVVAGRGDAEPRGQTAQRIRPPHRVDHLGLLPVREARRVDAGVFFYELDHLPHEVVLELELEDHPLELPRVVGQRARVRARPRRDHVPLGHECPDPSLCIGVPPAQDRRGGGPDVGGDGGAALPGQDAPGGRRLLLRGVSYRTRTGAGAVPAGDPAVEAALAGVAELGDHGGDAPEPVVEPERRLPLLGCEHRSSFPPRRSRIPAAPPDPVHFHEKPPSGPHPRRPDGGLAFCKTGRAEEPPTNK